MGPASARCGSGARSSASAGSAALLVAVVALRSLHGGGAVAGSVALGGGLNVGLHDPPAGAAPLEPGELHAQLASHAPRDRGGLDPLAVTGAVATRSARLGGRTAAVAGLGLPAALVRAGAAASLALVGLGDRSGLLLVLVRGFLGALILRALVRRATLLVALRLGLLLSRFLLLGGRLPVPARLARVADARDHLADGERVALLSQDLDQRAVAVGVVGHVGLVRLDLHERLAALDLAALVHEPLQHRALLHRVGQARHRDVAGHPSPLL